MPKIGSKATRAKIKEFKQQRKDTRLIAETLKRAVPEGTVIIKEGVVSLGGGKRAHAKYLKRKAAE